MAPAATSNMRKAIGVLLLGSVLFMSGMAWAGAEMDKATLEKAQNLYEDNCASCHGYEGKGDGPNAHAFSPRPADLLGDLKYGASEAEIFKTSADGVPKTAMQAWSKQLKEDDIHLLVQYVGYLRQQATPAK